MMRLSDTWLLRAVLALAAVKHCCADCCKPYEYPFGCPPRIPSCKKICRDCTIVSGWYCGKGSCNIFGCNCAGGCRQSPGGETGRLEDYCPKYGLPPRKRQRRRHLLASNSQGSTSDTMADDITASPFSASTQTCLDSVVAKYNASSLTEPQQIKDWLGCFDTDANSVLTSGEICSTLNCTAVGMTADQIMSQMDADGDGRVSMSEFDSDLQNSETSNVPPVLASWSLVGLWMVALVSMASWHL